MLESMLALPLIAVAELVLFLLLYGLTPLSGRQAAVVVAVLALNALLIYSLADWPGADVLAMYLAVLSVIAYLLGIVTHAREQRGHVAQGEQRWFHWGPALIVIFFAVLIALDGILVVIARQGLPQPVAQLILPERGRDSEIRSVFPGVVARDYQKKESLYNAYLEQVERQERRGWRVRKGWLERPAAGRAGIFQVQISERDGAPLDFATVSGVFQRPSDSRLDQSFAMQEVEPGFYRVKISLPEPGLWSLALQVRRDGQLHEVHASTTVADRRRHAEDRDR
jgi:nitrogen fixation protein FixH